MRHHLMRHPLRFVLFTALCCTAAAAQETAPRYVLTIYSNDANNGGAALFEPAEAEAGAPGGYAVVRDRRQFDLKSGNNTVQLRDIARWLDANALSARALNEATGAEIVSQRFEDETLSLDALVQKHLGHGVEIANDHGSGMPSTISGTLLSNVGGLSVQLADGRVTTVTEYSRVTFPDLPKGLAATPSLRWDIAAKKAGAQAFEVVYPTRGLAWRAEYGAWLANGNDCHVELSGWAQIANRSGADFRAARVKLVAGEPHHASAGAPPRPMLGKLGATRAISAEDSGILGDYREYTLDSLVDIVNGSLLRAALFPAQPLTCQRQYVFEGATTRANPNMAPITERGYALGETAPVRSTLAFKAERALPAGRLRVLENASDGSAEFVGEDNIGHTPRGETVALHLGNAFDLRGERRQTDFQIDKDKHTLSETFAIRIVNAGSVAQNVTLREHLYRWSQWTIAQSSAKFEKRNADTVDFKLDVAPNGNASVTYTVQYQWNESLK